MTRRARRRLAPVALAVVAALTACKRTPVAPVSIASGSRRVVARMNHVISAADRGAGGAVAVGTDKGAVLLVMKGKPPVALRGEGFRHGGAINALDFSPDGARLLSAGGKVAAFWNVGERTLVRQVRGPQEITAARLGPGGQRAYFATKQGHVMRWRTDRPGADGIKQFACGAQKVYPARLQLPKERRCPFGTYMEVGGQPICAYPVTHLVVHGNRLIRVCREGTLGVLDLSRLTTSFATVGHLGALAVPGADRFILGRADGEIRLYDPGPRKVIRTYHTGKTPAPPLAIAASGRLIAVATKGAVHLFHEDHPAAVSVIRTSTPVIWLDLSKGGRVLHLLSRKGTLEERSLDVTRR